MHAEFTVTITKLQVAIVLS